MTTLTMTSILTRTAVHHADSTLAMASVARELEAASSGCSYDELAAQMQAMTELQDLGATWRARRLAR